MSPNRFVTARNSSLAMALSATSAASEGARNAKAGLGLPGRPNDHVCANKSNSTKMINGKSGEERKRAKTFRMTSFPNFSIT